jgi:hypothetical protein
MRSGHSTSFSILGGKGMSKKLMRIVADLEEPLMVKIRETSRW